jgi:P-type Mg2+ transporter
MVNSPFSSQATASLDKGETADGPGPAGRQAPAGGGRTGRKRDNPKTESGKTGRDTIDKAAAASASPAVLLQWLGSSPAGLSREQVAERRAAYGPNSMTKEHTTAWRVLLRQFESPLVYFLMMAAALSFATGDASDGGIIVAILVINAVLGFSQEYRSERAVEKLAHLISDDASCRRSGAATSIDTADLVPGDIVLLKEGDVVPADMKLLEARDLQVDESQLTGESVAVAKQAEAEAGADSGRTSSLVFTGSVVRSGTLTGVVYATGNATSLGGIAAMSRGVHKVTEYQKWLASFSTLLMKVVLVSLTVVVIIKLALEPGSAHLASLLVFVIALAVSVVPEALPVIATLTMARGGLQLAKQHVVVKRLSSLEDLGDVTLLCTDKTGTLTEGQLSVTHLVSTDETRFEVLVAASTDTKSKGQEGTQAAFDSAFDAFIPEQAKQEARNYSVVGEVPFDPDARRRRVLVSKTGTAERTLVVIGAPETLLSLSSCPDRQHYTDDIAREGRQGMRHLAVAYRQVGPSEPADVLTLEHDLDFLGYVALSDPLRPGIADTIADAQQLGVGVKILTGDSADVASFVAGQVGLSRAGTPVLSGEDLSKLADGQLAAAAETSNVFARVSPEQKYELIGALKESHAVGYQGDGINDAPSLKLADVGIAVNTATDVAKASADIILLSQSLAVIVNGIRYGRAVFANINKYVVYTMVGNFGNFLALTVLYLLDTNLPVLASQLLLLSLLTDLPLLAISTDAVDAKELAQPSRYDARKLLTISLVLGTWTAVAEMAYFATLHGQSLPVRETSLYLFLSLTQLVVIFCVRNRGPFWQANRMSWPLLAAMVATAVFTVGLTYLPATRRLFSFTALPAEDVALLLLALLIYFLALDSLKVAYYKFPEKQKPANRPAVPARSRPGAEGQGHTAATVPRLSVVGAPHEDPLRADQ